MALGIADADTVAVAVGAVAIRGRVAFRVRDLADFGDLAGVMSLDLLSTEKFLVSEFGWYHFLRIFLLTNYVDLVTLTRISYPE
jgi:hypothetical protein